MVPPIHVMESIAPIIVGILPSVADYAVLVIERYNE
jgi:hypothetical protein